MQKPGLAPGLLLHAEARLLSVTTVLAETDRVAVCEVIGEPVGERDVEVLGLRVREVDEVGPADLRRPYLRREIAAVVLVESSDDVPRIVAAPSDGLEDGGVGRGVDNVAVAGRGVVL